MNQFFNKFIFINLFFIVIIFDTVFQSSANIVFSNSICANAIGGYSIVLNDLWKTFGYANTIIISNEQLLYEPEKVADLLEEHINFPKKSIDLTKMVTLRVNINDFKGEDQLATNFTKGVYAISNREPVLPITRSIIEQCWMKDCKIISRVTGFKYKCASTVSPEIQRYIGQYSYFPSSLEEEIRQKGETYLRKNNLIKEK